MASVAGGGGEFTGERRKPWQGPQGLRAVLRGWRESKKIARCLVLDQKVPGSEGRFVPFPPDLAPGVR